MCTKYIYLHGFASSPESETCKKMMSKIDNLECLDYCPDMNMFTATKNLLEYFHNIDKSDKIIVIGSSLGGYLADYIGAKFNFPVALINPLVDLDYLSKYIGTSPKNYYTSVSCEFSEEHLANLRKYEADKSTNNAVLVLLDEGDEIIDSKLAINKYNKAEVIVYPGGSHRFEHWDEAITEILKLDEFTF
jgi:predicted esterase YcpF (UPF0227 family)